MTEYDFGNSVENIHITENVLSEEDHKKLLDYTVNIKDWHTQPWGVKYFSFDKGLPLEIIDILDKVFRLGFRKCEEHFNVKFRVFDKHELHLIKFETDYAMNKHVDTTGDFAIIYYINDDYIGGEINFPWHDLKIKPKANSFVTFPSNQHYLHEVLKNTGERYSSTLWFNFEGSTYRGNINEYESTENTIPDSIRKTK
ncbi:MAG: hypothetical protein RL348_1298 [Bacteroidota bacterium]|jgi:hypothetical protein